MKLIHLNLIDTLGEIIILTEKIVESPLNQGAL